MRLFIIIFIAYFTFNVYSQNDDCYNKGKNAFDRQDYASAVEYFTNCIETGNIDSLYLLRGISHYYLGNYDKSLKDYDLYIRSYPNDEVGYFNRGILYLNLNN